MAVVANDIILERRTPLFTDAFESRSEGGAEDLADVLAMKDRAHVKVGLHDGDGDIIGSDNRALQAAVDRFSRRFASMEEAARDEGQDLTGLSLAELEELWTRAKSLERPA